jgi:DNA-binding NtrC family response regulator
MLNNDVVVVVALNNLKMLRKFMDIKNIVLFERYDGVRFVLERSLLKFQHAIQIRSSHWKNEIKSLIDQQDVDLLITELSRFNPTGLEISRYARKADPDLKIIWITVLGCDVFRELRKDLGNILCIEKPLEIEEFRRDVFNALEIQKTND